MMAAMMGGGRGGGGGRGRGRGGNVWTPDGAAPVRGPTSKVWVRPGVETGGGGGGDDADAAGGAASKPLCSFFAQGSCRYGDACRFSHDPSESIAAVAGDGAHSDAADAG